MALNRLVKVENIDEQIARLQNQRKLEMQKHKAEERKIRDRRLYRRAALLESLLPDTITLTDEQFNTFLHKTVANNFGRDKLTQIIAEIETMNTPVSTGATPPNKTNSGTANPQTVARSGA